MINQPLEGLIERVAGATAGSRELDMDVMEAAGECPHRRPAYHLDTGMYRCVDCDAVVPGTVVNPYSRSIDAALGLVERLLPGCKVSLFKQPDGTAGARVRTNDWHTVSSYEHYEDDETPLRYQPNGALAIILATLRAIQSTKTGDAA